MLWCGVLMRKLWMHSMRPPDGAIKCGCSQDRFSSNTSLVSAGKKFITSKKAPSCSMIGWIVVSSSVIGMAIGAPCRSVGHSNLSRSERLVLPGLRPQQLTKAAQPSSSRPNQQGNAWGNSNMAALDNCYNIHDLRNAAQKRLPKGVFDFFDRGTEDEVALHNNRAAFERIKLKHRALVDVSKRSMATTLFGKPVSMPMAIAPTGVA